MADKENKEKLDAVAVCLTCSNEWTVRDPGVKKKRKCPVCGKYRIKMKSDVAATPDALNSSAGTDSKNPETAGAIPPALPLEVAAPVGESKRETPKKEEKVAKAVSVKPKFLHGKEKKQEKVAAPIEERTEKGEEKGEENSGGGSLMWLAIAVFVIGAAIGVYFLWSPSRKKPDTPQETDRQIAVHPGVRRMMQGAVF